MEQKQNKRAKWDYDSCYAAAKQCKTLKEFREKFKSASSSAYKNGWASDYTWLEETRNSAGYWTRERCFEEAKKYKGRKEFATNCSVGYRKAR